MKTIKTILIAMLVIMASVQATAAISPVMPQTKTHVNKPNKPLKYCLMVVHQPRSWHCKHRISLCFDIQATPYGLLPINISYQDYMDCDNIPALIPEQPDEDTIIVPSELDFQDVEDIVTWALQQRYPLYNGQ